MAVGIAEINAFTTSRPGERALDRDSLLGETIFPFRQAVFWNTESDVGATVASVRGNKSKGKGGSLRIASLQKKDQNLPRLIMQSTKAAIRFHDRVSEKSCVEIAGS